MAQYWAAEVINPVTLRPPAGLSPRICAYSSHWRLSSKQQTPNCPPSPRYSKESVPPCSKQFCEAGLAMSGRMDSGCVAVGRSTSGWIGNAYAANIPTNNPFKEMFLMFIVLISLEVWKGGEAE